MPIVGNAIVSHPSRTWYLGRLLRHDALILSLPEDVLFEWCRTHPNSAPAFTATVVPILTTDNREVAESTFHPYMVRLLDESGNQEDVLQAIGTNIRSYFLPGSPTSYSTLYEAPLSKLRDEHPSAKVRCWAKATLRGIAAESKRIRNLEDERET